MIQTFISGWSLGIATGTTCLATCAPIYIPYLLAEERNDKQSFKITFLITLGRFLSYTIFGAVFGFAGSKIPIHSREIFTSIAYILLSVYLISTVFRIKRHSNQCRTYKWMRITKNPFFLGVLTGISFCPAFLIAVSNAIDISGALGGAVLFIAFFIGTSLFIIPLSFLGGLSKLKNLRKIAIILAIGVSIYFTYQGTTGIINYIKETKIDKSKLIESFFDTEQVYVLENAENENWKHLIHFAEQETISFYIATSIENVPNGSSVFYNSDNFEATEFETIRLERALKAISIKTSEFRSEEDYHKLIDFLKNVSFKYDPAEGYRFDFIHPPGEAPIQQ